MTSALSVSRGIVYHPPKSLSTALCGTTNRTLLLSIREDEGINKSVITTKVKRKEKKNRKMVFEKDFFWFEKMKY